jgi:hypothetical protein
MQAVANNRSGVPGRFPRLRTELTPNVQTPKLPATSFNLTTGSEMTEPQLLNPKFALLSEIQEQLRLARKTKPLWAKRLEVNQTVDTLEGMTQASPGDYLCRGVVGESWAQKASKLFEKYDASGELNDQGYERFDPKPEAAPVEAAQISKAFRVIANWGELTGKPHDYLVRSTTDPSDVWIVDKTVFEASYKLQGKNT